MACEIMITTFSLKTNKRIKAKCNKPAMQCKIIANGTITMELCSEHMNDLANKHLDWVIERKTVLDEG